jgi:hypothetical protein
MMRALLAAELLAVWERGLSQSPVERALALLGAACVDEPTEALARLSVGERDARLLRLRGWTFGPRLTSLVCCPSCGEQIELTLDVADLHARPAAEVGTVSDVKGAPDQTFAVTTAEYEVSFRLPNSLDLAAASAGAGVLGSEVAQAASFSQLPQEISSASNVERGHRISHAVATLLDRCIIHARHIGNGGEPVRASELPQEVAEAVADRMAMADPQAEIELAVDCPACGERWQAPFEIESFFWSEIGAWARRILSEVHVLASSYGWREADIFNMSAWRRQYYLDLISG